MQLMTVLLLINIKTILVSVAGGLQLIVTMVQSVGESIAFKPSGEPGTMRSSIIIITTMYSIGIGR